MTEYPFNRYNQAIERLRITNPKGNGICLRIQQRPDHSCPHKKRENATLSNIRYCKVQAMTTSVTEDCLLATYYFNGLAINNYWKISNEICLNLQYFVKTKTSDITLSQTQPTLTTRVSRQERNHPLWGQNNKHFGLTPKCKPVGPTLELYRLTHNNHNLKLQKQNHIITNHHNNLI